FPSKVHLLVSALGRTFQQLQESVPAGENGTAEERTYRVVAHVTRYLAKNRRLSGAMVRALMSAEADAARDVEAVGDILVGFIAASAHDPDVPPTEADALQAHIIGKV